MIGQGRVLTPEEAAAMSKAVKFRIGQLAEIERASSDAALVANATAQVEALVSAATKLSLP